MNNFNVLKNSLLSVYDLCLDLGKSDWANCILIVIKILELHKEKEFVKFYSDLFEKDDNLLKLFNFEDINYDLFFFYIDREGNC